MTAMETLLTGFTSVTTSVIAMSGKIITFVVDKPLLLIPIAMAFMGAGIGLVKSFK